MGRLLFVVRGLYLSFILSILLSVVVERSSVVSVRSLT
jgi:hypothetical protein